MAELSLLEVEKNMKNSFDNLTKQKSLIASLEASAASKAAFIGSSQCCWQYGITCEKGSERFPGQQVKINAKKSSGACSGERDSYYTIVNTQLPKERQVLGELQSIYNEWRSEYDKMLKDSKAVAEINVVKTQSQANDAETVKDNVQAVVVVIVAIVIIYVGWRFLIRA